MKSAHEHSTPEEAIQSSPARRGNRRTIARTSFQFANALAEQVYDPELDESVFEVWRGSGIDRVKKLVVPGGADLLPIDWELIRKRRILLPSQNQGYDSPGALIAQIRSHIRRYVRLPNEIEDVVVHYVLFTWLADRFETAPYLRLIGDLGVGKSRALKVIGDICYKPFKGSGCSSMAAIFRGMDRLGVCTLVLDETDFFVRNEEHQEMMNMLRVGYERNVGVLRAEREGDAFEPRDFDVFGPKLLAGRHNFPDPALESRCIRVYMQSGAPLDGIEPDLPPEYESQALALRNKLLRWRFEHFFTPLRAVVRLDIEPRLQQIYGPLASVVDDPETVRRLEEIMLGLQAELTDLRCNSVEGEVLQVLVQLSTECTTPPARVYCKDIAAKVPSRVTALGLSLGHIQPRRVATICRTFGLGVLKDRNGAYVLFDPEQHAALLRRHGLEISSSSALEEGVSLVAA